MIESRSEKSFEEAMGMTGGTKVISVAITGAAGQIGYSLIPMLLQREVFGRGVKVRLKLLEIPQSVSNLKGLVMELEDSGFGTIDSIEVGSDPNVIFQDIDWAILVGAVARHPGMERKDLLETNARIFYEQGRALDQVAKKNVKVLVVGNPANTNCLITLRNAPSIPVGNFFALTRLDQNRAQFQLANKAGRHLDEVKNVIVWGNHSTTQVPDFTQATIGGEGVEAFIDRDWLEGEFFQSVAERGGAVLKARKRSSALSAAWAITDCVEDLIRPNGVFSAGMYTRGNRFGWDEDLVFSMPLRSVERDGKLVQEVVDMGEFDPFIAEKIRASEEELVEERKAVFEYLK
ncbi:MAG: malate dehydrogenase [Chlamydiia bacterium]|nr:malate dehydrogenase [Chlamydiia bacterium]